MKKRYYVPWLKGGIYKPAFFLEGIQPSSLIIKRPKQIKQDRCFDKTNAQSGNYCK